MDFFIYRKKGRATLYEVHEFNFSQATKPKVNVCLFHSVFPEDSTKKPPVFTLKCKA